MELYTNNNKFIIVGISYNLFFNITAWIYTMFFTKTEAENMAYVHLSTQRGIENHISHQKKIGSFNILSDKTQEYAAAWVVFFEFIPEHHDDILYGSTTLLIDKYNGAIYSIPSSFLLPSAVAVYHAVNYPQFMMEWPKLEKLWFKNQWHLHLNLNILPPHMMCGNSIPNNLLSFIPYAPFDILDDDACVACGVYAQNIGSFCLMCGIHLHLNEKTYCHQCRPPK